MKEVRFILQNENSYVPIRTEVERIDCNKCGKHFYVNYKAVPEVCPFCENNLL